MSALLTAMIFLAPPLCRVMEGNASYTKADKARRGGRSKKGTATAIYKCISATGLYVDIACR